MSRWLTRLDNSWLFNRKDNNFKLVTTINIVLKLISACLEQLRALLSN